jgi:malate dehydrogenase
MKISVIGAGNVGASTALFLAQRGLGQILLVDVVEDMPKGKALDMLEASPVARFSTGIKGTNQFDEVFDSDVVVVTAGVPRKAGMTRMDLLRVNADIVSDIALKVTELAQEQFSLS